MQGCTKPNYEDHHTDNGESFCSTGVIIVNYALLGFNHNDVVNFNFMIHLFLSQINQLLHRVKIAQDMKIMLPTLVRYFSLFIL